MNACKAAFAAAALAAALTGCSDGGPGGGAVEVRVGVLPSLDHLPLYVMQEEGYASARGLAIEERPYDSGSEALAGVLAGEVDVADIGIPSLLRAAAAGDVPARAVAVAAAAWASPDHPLIGVVAGSGVTKWSELAGARIGVNNPTSLGAAGIRGRLAVEGVALGELVEVPFTNMGLGVRTGALTAAVMVDPYLTQSLLRGDGTVLGWVVGGEPMVEVEAAAWTAGRGFLEGSEDALEQFLSAYLDALEWIDRHPESATELAAARLALAPEVATALNLPEFPDGGRSDERRLQAMIDALTPAGEQPIEASLLVDPVPLERARAGR